MDNQTDFDVRKIEPQGEGMQKCYQLNSVKYNKKLYFFGGTSIPANQYKVPFNHLHTYNPQGNRWMPRLQNKQKFEDSSRSSQICTIAQKSLYVFGGSCSDGTCTNSFYIYSFNTNKWTNIQSTSNFPQPREGGTLVNYMNKFLVLFGGVNIKQKLNYDEFWVYSIEKNEWSSLESVGIPPRIQQASCQIKNKIYLFGGEWKQNEENRENKLSYLSDFYEIQVKKENDDETVSFCLREIEDKKGQERPRGRSGHKLLPIKRNKLLLIGGESEFEGEEKGFRTLNDIWLFDIFSETWIRLQSNIQIPPICEFACESIDDEVYLFGGLSSYDNINGNMYNISLNMEEIENKLKQKIYRNWNTCDLCYEVYKNKNQHMEPTFKLSNRMVSELIQNLTHPFSAIGLFCDNSMNYNASYLKIVYSMFNKKAMLVFEDDSKLNFDNIEYEDITVNFEGGENLNYNSIEKRSRLMIQKENNKKEYGMNVKVGGLRLCDQILSISITSNMEARISLFTYEEGEYVSYFYVYDIKGKKLMDDYSQFVEERIMKYYSLIVIEFISRYCGETQSMKIRPYRNGIFCLNLKEQNGELELIPNENFTDLLYIPNKELVPSLNLSKSLLLKSVDVSLQIYLTMLYLKNDHTRISLQVMCPSPSFQPFKKIIVNQEILDGIDELIKQNLVYEIDAALNFQFKIVELYLIPDLSKDFHIFHNGVLLYHRNRLIKRYGIEIGMLLDQYGESKDQQFFNMFGVLQLPDSLAVNSVKNDFVNQMMLDKFYSRLNFIGHWFKENFNASIKTKIVYPKRKLPIMSKGYLPEANQRQLPSKKVKIHSFNDEDYHQEQSSD